MSADIRRVLMTADAVGGVWDYALELARGLAAGGASVTLAVMGPAPRADQEAAARAIPALDLVAREYRLEWMASPWADVREAGDWLLELEAAYAPDVVHLNGYAHAALPWSTPVAVVAHSCVCSWWWAVRGGPPPAEWDPYRRAVRAGLDAADAIVAPSAAMLRALAAQYGPLEGAVIPNGRSESEFAIGPKEPLVLSAGRLWDEAKNVAALAAVAGRLPWRVAVAGEHREPVCGDARADALEHLGRVPAVRLREWLARTAIYALPARYEPFGLSVLEAALSSCALVLGDIASLREGWDGAALFVPPDDHEALHGALVTLIRDEPRRQELARRARLRALAFPADRMVTSYRRLYASLLEPSREALRGEPACRW